MSLRGDALEILDAVVPSDYGDSKFSAIIGDMYREGPGSGTTCGFLTSYLLFMLGCRRPEIVNRNDPSSGLRYHIGENISRLVGGAKELAAWRDGPQGIKPGDCYFMSNGPPLTEHVGCYRRSPDPRHWETDDAGQRNNAGHQAARRRIRGFDGARLETPNGWKPVVGYVDIAALPYTVGPQVAVGGSGLLLLGAALVGGWILLEG
jgi:hypothetical protein